MHGHNSMYERQSILALLLQYLKHLRQIPFIQNLTQSVISKGPCVYAKFADLSLLLTVIDDLDDREQF